MENKTKLYVARVDYNGGDMPISEYYMAAAGSRKEAKESFKDFPKGAKLEKIVCIDGFLKSKKRISLSTDLINYINSL